MKGPKEEEPERTRKPGGKALDRLRQFEQERGLEEEDVVLPSSETDEAREAPSAEKQRDPEAEASEKGTRPE